MFITAVDIVFKWMVQLQRDSIVTVHYMTICMHSCNGPLSLHKASCYAHTLYPLQGGCTPLHLAAIRGHTTCVELLLSTPGIDVNIKDEVSWFIECCCTVLCLKYIC